MRTRSGSRVLESEQVLRRVVAVQQDTCLDEILAIGLSRLGDALKRCKLCTNAVLKVTLPPSGADIKKDLGSNTCDAALGNIAQIMAENISNLEYLVMTCASTIMYQSDPSALLRGVIGAFSGYLPMHESDARSLDKLRCDDAAVFVWSLAWKRVCAQWYPDFNLCMFGYSISILCIRW